MFTSVFVFFFLESKYVYNISDPNPILVHITGHNVYMTVRLHVLTTNSGDCQMNVLA